GSLIRQGEKIRALLHCDRLFLRSVLRLHVDAEFRLNALPVVNLLYSDERLIGCTVCDGAGDHDLFDQLQLKRPDRIEAIDEVVRVPVRRRVSERAQRVQSANCFLSLLRRVNALGFVNDHDGTSGLNELDGPAAEAIPILVHYVAALLVLRAREVLSKGVNIDDLNLQRVARGKLAQTLRCLRGVNEVSKRQVVEDGSKMIGCDLNVLEDTFANRDARYHDHEFLETIATGQLKDGPEIDVGLAGACLHLDREMRARALPVGGSIKQVPGLDGFVRCIDAVADLDGAQVPAQLHTNHQKTVSEATLGLLLAGEQTVGYGNGNHRELRRPNRLAFEQVDDRGNGVELKRLVGIKLNLHDVGGPRLTPS